MNLSIRAKLSIMMFLQYVIWGAWLPLLTLYLGNYLHFDGSQQAWVLNAFAFASLTAWLFGGQLADRYFEQSKFLAFSHLIGGVAMIGLMFTETFWPTFVVMLVHCFFYVPTMSVTNAIAFANVKDAQKDFGFIRVWGTIGWIAASWPYTFILVDWAKVSTMAEAGGFVAWLGKALATNKTGAAMQTALTSMFLVAGIVSFVLAAFCLSLPRTPPKKDITSAFAPLASLKLLAVPSILVMFVVTFLDSLVHYCYFFWTGPFFSNLGVPANWIAPAMSIGQIAEIVTMAYLGFFLKRLGWRTTMIIGVMGQMLRFGMYSLAAKFPELFWFVILCNVVHGLAYAFFFATVYIFVDENFPQDVRTSAQSLFNLLILGLGPLLGNILWGSLGDSLKNPETKHVDFFTLFLYPFGIGLFATIVLAIFFHPQAKEPVPEEVPVLVN